MNDIDPKADIPQALLNELMQDVINIQKRYSHQLQGVQSERRDEVRKALINIAARGLSSED